MTRIFSLMVLVLGLMLGSPAAWAGVNVNSASQSELETLPGIGPSKAAAIIEYRNTHGAFTSLSGLDAVPGIGPATLSNIGPLVEFGEAGEAPSQPAPAEEPPASSSSSSGSSGGGASSGSSGGAVNVNTASASELQTLPGIGASKAQAILDDRNANGPFASCSDLQRVTGIGPATVATIGSGCTTQ
jgi:competence protein ComEA